MQRPLLLNAPQQRPATIPQAEHVSAASARDHEKDMLGAHYVRSVTISSIPLAAGSGAPSRVERRWAALSVGSRTKPACNTSERGRVVSHGARESGPSACGGVRAAREARLGIVRGASVERRPITFLGTRRNVEERA